jgi:hypothetical protein
VTFWPNKAVQNLAMGEHAEGVINRLRIRSGICEPWIAFLIA